jgi:RND superfamily putative drug exporter
VIVSMAGLYLAGDVVFSSLATGSVIVVAVAMIGSLTVLPALLAKLGRRVDRPRVPLLGRLSNRQGPRGCGPPCCSPRYDVRSRPCCWQPPRCSRSRCPR